MSCAEMHQAGQEYWINDFIEEHDREPTKAEIEAAEGDFMDTYLDIAMGCY